jgi:hypothetical protein
VSLADADRDYFGNEPGREDDGVVAYASFRTTLLLLDSTEQERRGLAFRRLTKLTCVAANPLCCRPTAADPPSYSQPLQHARACMRGNDLLAAVLTRRQPWVTENPLFFHLSETTPAGVRKAVDDAVEVGGWP